MSIRNRIGVVLGVSAGALCATQMVVADHHVTSGSYEVVFSGITDLTTVEFSDYSVTAGSVDGTSTIITSSGGPFVVGESGIYSGVIYAKKIG